MSPLPDTFRALVLDAPGQPATLRTLTPADLPDGEVLVRVSHSSLNYKDGLAVTARGKIARTFPLAPGIDLAGTVVESSHDGFGPGDAVLGVGRGLGERHWGGFAEWTRVPASTLTALPAGLDARHAMALGTAGLTAGLCVLALEDAGVTPAWAAEREVVVTGASGGVGSVAVALLAARGYRVAAVTGRMAEHDWLRALGAAVVLPREALAEGVRGPLGSERWAGAVDAVGGAPLAQVLATTAYDGAVAACGLAADAALATSVVPFILRGVRLLGIDSVQCPEPRRQRAWAMLAEALPRERVDAIATSARLGDVPALAERILAGQVRGRVVVEVEVGG